MHRPFFVSLAAAVVLGVLSGAASASALNLTGTWSANYHCEGGFCAGADYPATDTLTQAEGSSGVTGSNGVEAISGTLTGNSFAYESQVGGYKAGGTLTIAADGQSWSGHVTDSNGTQGTYTATRTSGGAGEGKAKEEEAAKKAKEEAEKSGTRPTGTMVTCNYEFATSQNTCVASVGDGGAQPPVTPTGTVSFVTTSGGFANGATCTLSATPLSPQVASCSLVYQTAYSGLPSITASYGGDAHHAASSGHTQFLGLGAEGTFETPAGPAGEYPNEVILSTEVPVVGATVEADVQAPDAHSLPVAITLPRVSSSLDATSALDLRVAEALVSEVDVEGALNMKHLTALSESVDKLESRAIELSKSSRPGDQAQGQQLLKDAAETTEAMTKMLQERSQAAKDAIEGGRGAARAEQSIEQLDAKAVELLQSGNAADQLRGQQLLNESNARLEALLRATRQRGESIKKVISNTSAVGAARRTPRIRTRRVRTLGYARTTGAAAGKLTVKVHLSSAALRRLARRRTSLTVYVRVLVILPSKQFKGGVPHSFVQRVTLKRSPRHKR